MMTRKPFEIMIFPVFCLFISCSKIDTIDLPALDSPSFSSEEILKQREVLEKKKKCAKELNGEIE